METKSVEKEKTGDGKAVSRKVNITIKDSSLLLLLDEVNRDHPRVAKPNFNIYHQYSSLKHLRKNISSDEVVVQLDLEL